MKRFLILLVALLIMQTVFLIANDDIVWIRGSDNIQIVRFTPDDSLIAINNRGKTAIYKTENSEYVKEFNPIVETQFTPDGKYMIGYFNTNELILIDMLTWEKRTDIEKAPSTNIRDYDVRSDSKKMIASYNKKYEFSIWDIESGKIERTISFVDDIKDYEWIEIASLRYGRDEKEVIFIVAKAYRAPKLGYSYKYRAHIIDLESGIDKGSIDVRSSIISMSKDKSMVALTTKSANNAFSVFNSHNLEEIFYIPKTVQDTYIGNSIVFSNDNKYVVSGFDKITIYEIPTGNVFYKYNTGNSIAIDISHNSEYITAGHDDWLYLYRSHFGPSNVKETESISDIQSYPNPTNSNSVTFEFILLNSGITKIQLFDLSGRIVKNIENTFIEAGNQKYEIDISELTSGQYNLTIETITGIKSHKILVGR